MNTTQAKEHARKHGPATAIATTVAVAAVLIFRPGQSTSVVWRAPDRHEPARSARLVDCGDASGAVLTQEDDTRGQITLGPDSGGRCTLFFARPWASVATCVVGNGHVAGVTTTELAIDQAAPVVTYDCAESK